jgi:hypothetical protein
MAVPSSKQQQIDDPTKHSYIAGVQSKGWAGKHVAVIRCYAQDPPHRDNHRCSPEQWGKLDKVVE